jgi:glutathione S-transferase
MSDELVFRTNPMSRGRIVRWMLEEVRQPDRSEPLDYATTMAAPEYLAINQMGKVPALRHGDSVVTEAAALALMGAHCTAEIFTAEAQRTPR